MITYSLVEGKPETQLIGSVLHLYNEIFGQVDEAKFYQRINTQSSLLTALAWNNDQLIGFKIGYAVDASAFYSWIGGVEKNFRNKGVAQKLMNLQHDWCKKHGYKTVRTKTMNRWKSMLVLNLKSGFDITETYTDTKGELKIILEKTL